LELGCCAWIRYGPEGIQVGVVPERKE
jgi:hypothetical protein